MIVSWMTTNQCNLKCVHCYQDAEEATERELTTDEAKKMIDEIARAGFKIMIFSGGEPLCAPTSTSWWPVRPPRFAPGVRSNGTLITDEVACRLKEAGAAAMGVSVDSLDAARHDKFRGLPNAHALTMAGIEACKRAGLPFQLHTTVVDWNRDEVCAITDFAEEIGAVAHYIFFLIPVGRGEYIQETSLEVLENEALLREIMEKSAEVSIDVKPHLPPQFTRVAKQLGIDTRSPAAAWPASPTASWAARGPFAPRLHDRGGRTCGTQPFDEIWKTSLDVRRLRTRGLSGACGTCDYKDGCGLPGPGRLLPRRRHPRPRRLLRPWSKLSDTGEN
ncbi:MAG: radical SAM/SPASM domain-containing protein [Adlercreutzia sp.]